MKICSQCGHEMTDDSLFCNKCGHKTEKDFRLNVDWNKSQGTIGRDTASQEPVSTNAPPFAYQGQTSPSIGAVVKRSRAPIVIIISAVSMCVLGALVILVLWSSGKFSVADEPFSPPSAQEFYNRFCDFSKNYDDYPPIGPLKAKESGEYSFSVGDYITVDISVDEIMTSAFMSYLIEGDVERLTASLRPEVQTWSCVVYAIDNRLSDFDSVSKVMDNIHPGDRYKTKDITYEADSIYLNSTDVFPAADYFSAIAIKPLRDK